MQREFTVLLLICLCTWASMFLDEVFMIDILDVLAAGFEGCISVYGLEAGKKGSVS
jgi:hypothetical protein